MIYLAEYKKGIDDGYRTLVHAENKYNAEEKLREENLLSPFDEVNILEEFDEIIGLGPDEIEDVLNGLVKLYSKNTMEGETVLYVNDDDFDLFIKKIVNIF